MNNKHRLVKIPILGSLFVFAFRVKESFKYFFKDFGSLLVWLFQSREIRNFTYELEGINKNYLVSLVADVTGRPFDEITGYVQEIEHDEELKLHIKAVPKESYLARYANEEMPLGRRIGWYAFVRALKPKIVVETGLDKGLGSCVLTSALLRNKAEGFDGYYYGTDIDPHAGYLLGGQYKTMGTILYGDSIQSLERFDKAIDLFINDSDHSDEYEMREYRTIKDKLSSNAVILGDNSHSTDKLFKFSQETERHFIFFQEKPKNHWYPGDGIGVSFKRIDKTI
jgi:hypothetical protein